MDLASCRFQLSNGAFTQDFEKEIIECSFLNHPLNPKSERLVEEEVMQKALLQVIDPKLTAHLAGTTGRTEK